MDDNLNSIELSILLGRITNLDTPTAKKITLKDLSKLMDVLKPFLPSGEVGG